MLLSPSNLGESHLKLEGKEAQRGKTHGAQESVGKTRKCTCIWVTKPKAGLLNTVSYNRVNSAQHITCPAEFSRLQYHYHVSICRDKGPNEFANSLCLSISSNDCNLFSFFVYCNLFSFQSSWTRGVISLAYQNLKYMQTIPMGYFSS